MDSYDWMEKALADREAVRAASEHPDWRVRYGAAVAIGRLRDPALLPLLLGILQQEEGRPLYSQPRARFPGSHDDTRMAEQIRAVREEFDQEATEEQREAWKCRGRVKQACLFAIGDIGSADAALRGVVQTYLMDGDDVVRMAAARALGTIGDGDSLALLAPLLTAPEYCSRTEAVKSVSKLKEVLR